MKEITIRPMKEMDIGQAADIHRRVVREGLVQSTNYPIENLFKSFISKSPKTSIVAEKDDNVAGFVVGSIKEWSFGLERSGWIELVAVDPKFMGIGIGKKLGEALIKIFKDEGIREVYTSVEWDGGDMIAFFKSIGFDKSSFINLERGL